MADDWQVGDLALCVATTINLPGYGQLAPSKILRVGAVYTVNSVRWSVGHNCVALGLAEARSRGPFGDWHAAVFRKINPLSESERDTFLAELPSPLPPEPVRVAGVRPAQSADANGFSNHHEDAL